jgi:hypothetical protein
MRRDNSGRNADTRIHQGNPHQIGRYVAFDLLGDIDSLPLVLKIGQHLDQSTQKRIARNQEKNRTRTVSSNPLTALRLPLSSRSDSLFLSTATANGFVSEFRFSARATSC